MSEPFNIIDNNDEFLENAKIKVVGAGGGGGNMLNYMVEHNVNGEIELICANTDSQALRTNKAPIKIQLGKELTKGLGAGMDPEVGKAAAEESFDELKKVLEGSDLVFISAGMGGGTGTGAAPVIARIAKELGALAIGVVTKPFRSEGKLRTKLAEQGCEELKKECDSIVTIQNQKILSIIDRKAGRKESFNLVNKILYQAVIGISNMIISCGEDDINVDFADLKKVMSHKGIALMGTGDASGDGAAFEALNKAIESPLLDVVNIEGAMGLLAHFTMNENYPFAEIDEAMASVEEKAGDEAHVIVGLTTDNSLADDEIKVTIVATGFEKEKAVNTIKERSENMQDLTKLATNAKKMAVGANEFSLELNNDELDLPTWMRNSRD